jgi:hypothetical protein
MTAAGSAQASHQLAVLPDDLPSLAVQEAEQRRWLLWFGLPALMAAIFLAVAVGTGAEWILTLTVIGIISDIFVLIMLVLTTDTNGAIDEGPAPHRA